MQGRRKHGAIAVALALAAVTAIAGCGGASTASSGGITVVAAENFWGSIASQLAGSKASVRSIIVNPATDPHSYEPTAADARTLASASLVIVNGLGYDPWAPKLLAANPLPGRKVLTVGELAKLPSGSNPHRWYDPADVELAAHAITASLKQLEPNEGPYFDRQLSALDRRGLAQYRAMIALIRARYKGIPVGASESIFVPLAQALGLDLITPGSFMKAISEGTDVTAQDTVATQRQITRHQIKAWVYNSQNATPAIQRLNGLARANNIQIASVTETLSPPSASFEQWQTAQLRALAAALHQATGR